MNIAPILAVTVFQYGKELCQRSKPVAIFEVIVFCNLSQKLYIFLVQNSSILVSYFGRCPLDICDLYFAGISSSCRSDSSPNDVRDSRNTPPE